VAILSLKRKSVCDSASQSFRRAVVFLRRFIVVRGSVHHKYVRMLKTLVVALLILLAALTGANVAAQQISDSKTTSSNPVLARAQHLISLMAARQEDAPAQLKQALSDENWYVRGEAARGLGRLGDPSVEGSLLPLLKDESWFVRVSSLEAISKLGPVADVSAFQDSLASDDCYVRARAIATSSIGGNAATEGLIKALGDREQVVRRTAAKALGDLKSRAAVDALIALLKDEEPKVRKAAGLALGKIGDKKAASAVQIAASENNDWEYSAALYRLGNHNEVDKVIAALHSQYDDTKELALESLLEFGDNRALPALVGLAAENQSNTNTAVSIRVKLASGLAAFSGEEAALALVNFLSDAEPGVRAASASSLAKLTKRDPKSDLSQRSLIALVGALKKENSPIVATAIIETLPEFDHNRVADLLLDTRNTEGKFSPSIVLALAKAGVTAESEASQLSAGDVAERVRAADRLARLGDSRAVAPLIEALNAKEVAVRVKAAQALGSLRDRNAVEPLMAASRSPEPAVRAASILALGLIGDHTAADALFVAARDTDSTVREASVASLSAFGISVEKVTPDLTSSNWQVRAAAVTTLARLGDPNAVSSISLALKDRDIRVRSEAARALGSFNDRNATDALLGALHDQSADVRVEATFSLGRLKDNRALAPLTSLLGDRDPRVSLAAAESLARLQDPRATRVLIDSLSNADWRVRSRASQVLARVATEGLLDQAARPLAAALSDRDPVVRYYASEALVGIGPRAVPFLIEVFHAHREADRDRAARVLWRIGAPAVEPLLAVLQEKSATPEMRTASASALGMIGDPRAVKGLVLLLRDERYFVRQRAAQALGRIGEPAVDMLLEMANSSVPATREAAVEALGTTASKRGIDRTIELLSDSNANVRSAAVRALGETSSERAISPLISLLRDESSALRSQAAASLARLGYIAVPSLISALKDSRPSVRQLSAEALGEIGSREAVAPLIALITSDQSGARPEAIEALGKIGDASAIVPILSISRTGSVVVRKKAMLALAGFRDGRAIDALIAALSDQNEEVRQAAAAGLGEVGDERAIARLERLADNDVSSDVRAAAAQAIERIRSDQRPGLKQESLKPTSRQ
jgi:HEAT repeat protein